MIYIIFFVLIFVFILILNYSIFWKNFVSCPLQPDNPMQKVFPGKYQLYSVIAAVTVQCCWTSVKSWTAAPLQIYKLLLISSWHRNWPRSMDLSGGHDGARYGRGWLCYQCTAVTAAGSSAHLHVLREHLNRRKELETTEATSTGGLRAHNESLSLFRHHRGKCPGAGWTQSSSTITVVPLLQIII